MYSIYTIYVLYPEKEAVKISKIILSFSMFHKTNIEILLIWY